MKSFIGKVLILVAVPIYAGGWQIYATRCGLEPVGRTALSVSVLMALTGVLMVADTGRQRIAYGALVVGVGLIAGAVAFWMAFDKCFTF